MTDFNVARDEIIGHARDLYDLLHDLAEDPAEACDILGLVHVFILANRSEDANLDDILRRYCDTVKINCENIQSTVQ